jgi:long-chain acyl-CoA synthetase
MRTLMPDEIAHLVAFSDAKALFADEDIWSDLFPLALGDGLGVRCVLSLADWSLLDGCSDRAMSERRPREDREISFPQSEPDDLATICFTSGTSGNAKGVMLSYRNISNVMQNELKGFPADNNNQYVSTMPFAHTYGLMTDLLGQLLLRKHIHIPINVLSNEIIPILSIVRPYAFVTIPMVLAKLYARFAEKLSAILGGKCKQLYVGGASLSNDVIDGLLAQGLPYSMGYGLTETCFLISYIQSFEYRYGSCGRICIGMTARISPIGEILVKGENVMLGYYKDPEATAAKIDKDGWLHTGDKGHLDEDGYLYVEGRLEQDIIVLPNGENIRPDHIEALINALPEVSESIVLDRDGHLVAIVVLSSPSLQGRDRVRLSILRAVNPQLPLFSQLYDVEITDQPLARTEKQTLKRYLYS